MTTFEEQASHYLGALQSSDRENAYHRLIELGPDVIPLVMTRFSKEHDATTRSTLVNIAWRTSAVGALTLLKEALDDSEPGVWEEAIDGLAAVGGRTALVVLRDARRQASAEKAEWLDEAIEQVIDAMTHSGDAEP